MTELVIEKAMLERNPAIDGFDTYLISQRLPHGEVAVICSLPPLALSTVLPGMPRPAPAFQLSMRSAQAMLDALWEAGIRPSSGQQQGANTDLVVTLMKEHLADLRRVVFGQEVVVGPDTPRTTTLDHI